MANELSKKEFLKRYLENEKDSERKRKKKQRTIKVKTDVPRLKIVDQDINLKSIKFGEKEEDDEDEAPVIAEVIDDRPVEEKLKELYESSRWKKLDSDGTSLSPFAATAEKGILKSSHEFSKKYFSSEKSDAFISKQSSKISHDSDSDISPSRTGKQSKNNRHDSDSDFSPPRHEMSYKSQRHDSDNDVPHRHQADVYNSRKQNSDSDISPPRDKVFHKSSKYDSDSDISPPRHKAFHKSAKYDSDSDISPPHRDKLPSQMKSKDRRHNSNSDTFSHHHQTINKANMKEKSSYKRRDSDSYLAQQKKSSPAKLKSSSFRNESRQNSDSDISPPRSSFAHNTLEGKKLNKTLSGLKAGLQNSKGLQKEAHDMRIKEKVQLSMLSDEMSGRNAATIMRDRKTGMKRDLTKEQESTAEKNAKARKYEEKYNKWGKGIEQTQDKMEKMKDEVYEMSKPLARYKDDEDLDERLKSVMREDDPMAEYIKKKKQKNVPEYPVYSGPPAPPNRFHIQPGYRWDGVDRSNGFEKKYFEKINSTKAIQDEAYLWSVQDM